LEGKWWTLSFGILRDPTITLCLTQVNVNVF
jgi:hypothetical protein